MEKTNKVDMSEDDSKSNLDKDDEDIDFVSFNPKSHDKSSEESKKSRKKSNDSFEYQNPIYSLFKKHRRSDSSDSSNSFEQRNKKKKKELTAFQRSYIQSQKENFDKNYNILKEDFKLLEEYEKKIFKDTNLDLMFIMDLTGSMGVWLEEAQRSIKDIIEEITDNNPGSKIRISFIGYKDFTDENEERTYNSKEFTEDINEINEFISGLDCFGGGDIPEDIVGALKHALNMKWESNAKYAILVCDAPCHGKQYHSICLDKFENGDPSGTTLEEVMKKFYEKGITFYCLEIDSSTEKMFKIMKDVYNDNNKFHIEKLWNAVNQFSFFVAFSASVLLGNSKYNKYKFKDIISNYRKETIKSIVKKYINNNNINITNNDNDSITNDLIGQLENLGLGAEDKKLFDFINRMNDLNISLENKNEEIKNNNDYIHINLDEKYLQSLSEKEINYNLRSLFYNKNVNVVNDWGNPLIEEKELKTQIIMINNELKKDIDNSQYELTIYDKILDTQKKASIPFLIEKNLYNNPKLFIKKISYNELICEQIGDYFNILLFEKLPYLKQFIKFQRHCLYELDIQNKNKQSENLINDNFYLNSKYIISEHSVEFQDISFSMEKRTLQSFSHFSYQISGGQLLIGNFTYDKQLKKVTNFKIYFLKENGYKNILEFFASHICDNTCKTLELIHPRKKNNPIIINEQFYSKKYLTNVKLCKCCSFPIHEKYNNKNLTCEFCSSKEIYTKFNATCSQCKNSFFYSTFDYKCNLEKYPIKCPKCNSNF